MQPWRLLAIAAILALSACASTQRAAPPSATVVDPTRAWCADNPAPVLDRYNAIAPTAVPADSRVVALGVIRTYFTDPDALKGYWEVDGLSPESPGMFATACHAVFTDR